jgi:hypothetical protein
MGPLLLGVLIWDFGRRLGFGEVCRFFCDYFFATNFF